jgi:hypothetical protein
MTAPIVILSPTWPGEGGSERTYFNNDGRERVAKNLGGPEAEQ